MDNQFTIGFAGVSTAQANRYAESLSRAVRDIDPSLQVERQRTQENTQDFGATLAIVLGTASASALAKGIANWISRNAGARIEISANGEVLATNLDSKDAAKIAQAFSPQRKQT